MGLLYGLQGLLSYLLSLPDPPSKTSQEPLKRELCRSCLFWGVLPYVGYFVGRGRMQNLRVYQSLEAWPYTQSQSRRLAHATLCQTNMGLGFRFRVFRV